MTTFDDDSIRLRLACGVSPTLSCRKLGLEWPPPPRLFLAGNADPPVRVATDDDDPAFILRRVSCSAITDEQRAGMTNVFRGAQYEYEHADAYENAIRL